MTTAARSVVTCPHCGKQVEPAVEHLARAHAGQLKVVKLNVDDAMEIAGRHGVRGIPVLLLMRVGNEVDRIVGAPSQAQLEDWLERHLGTPAGAAG